MIHYKCPVCENQGTLPDDSIIKYCGICSMNTGKSVRLILEPVNKNTIGHIKPIRAYQTTDGEKFVGENSYEQAVLHQEKLNKEKTSLKPKKKKKKRKTP